MKDQLKKQVLITSFILTLAIFTIAFMISYGLDFLRYAEIDSVMATNEINTVAYALEKDFFDIFGGDKCAMMSSRIYDLKRELHKVGIDLTMYGGKSFLKKKDFDYLKRKYFLLELKFYSLIKELNEKCSTPYITILFFYKIEDTLSERQGYVLDDFSQIEDYKTKIAVLSFDKDYKDEPLLKLLILKYNVTKAPTLIINDKIKKESIIYTGELNATMLKILREDGVDKAAKNYNFNYTLDANGVNKTKFILNLKSLFNKNISNFAKGDISLIIGRIKNNNSLICSSLAYYDNVTTNNSEEKAIIYETYAAIGCGRNRQAFLLEASKEWNKTGNKFRASLDKELALMKKPELKFKKINVSSNITLKNFTNMTIGSSFFILNSSDILVSQADRVNRDWISHQIYVSPFDSSKLLTTFSERLYYNKTELLPEIGWHEGARIKKLKKIGLKHKIATGTLVAKMNNKWYAPNENGIFMFDVPLDKLLYLTTRFLTNDIAVIVDTHGINMIVEQAMRYNATMIYSDCDNIGKVKAALYLSKKNKKVVCSVDKYLPFALGNKGVMGNPPIKVSGNKAVVGNQSITINKNEKIVVINTTLDKYAISYYQTPTFYFNELEKFIDLDTYYVTINDFNQMYKVVEKAEEVNATVIAARVFNSNDYYVLRKWLEENNQHKLVLFHSYPYPYGYKIMSEFKEQTTFDDINPIFK